MSDKDKLDESKESFKRKVDAESEQRKASEDDLRFALLSEQWPSEVKAQREREGRPCLTINRLPAFLKQVTNEARINRPTINCKPIGDGSSKDTARILNDIVRNIETQSSANIVYDTAADFAASCGIGYFLVRVDYTCDDAWDQDIFLERVNNPFAIYGDENSKEATSIDWNDAFVTDWYSEARFKARWKDAKAASFEVSDTGDANWFQDKRVRVAEHWFRDEVPTELLKLSDGKLMLADVWAREGELLSAQGIVVEGTRPTKTYRVRQRLMTGVDVLEENEWLGKYIPIIPMYGEEVNVNGKRHFISLIRRAKDPQSMFNFWRTASTELVALAPKAPFIGPVGAFATDADKWATANTKSHPYIEFDVIGNAPMGGMPQRQPFAGVPAGALQEALNASDDMKAIIGIYDPSLGARSNETSGKAINARKVESDVSTYNFMDNRNRAVEHGGKVVLDLIPKIYTSERIMRCIREDGTVYNVPINQPVRELPAEMPGEQPQYQPVPEGMRTQMQGDPNMAKVLKVFDLTTGKYDITVTAGPAFLTRRQEAAEQMMEFIRVFPQSAPLIGDLLAKNLDWPGSDQVAERLRAMLPPQAQGQIQPIVQQLQQMLQKQDAMAKQAVAQLQGEIQKLTQQLNDKQVDNAFKAQELSLKDREVQIKERDMGVKELDANVTAQVTQTQQVELPIAEFQAQFQSLAQVTASLQAAAVALAQMAPKPAGTKRKTATAKKDPASGTWVLDSVEVEEPQA